MVLSVSRPLGDALQAGLGCSGMPWDGRAPAGPDSCSPWKPPPRAPIPPQPALILPLRSPQAASQLSYQRGSPLSKYLREAAPGGSTRGAGSQGTRGGLVEPPASASCVWLWWVSLDLRPTRKQNLAFKLSTAAKPPGDGWRAACKTHPPNTASSG